jgi:hypothetical protein
LRQFGHLLVHRCQFVFKLLDDPLALAFVLGGLSQQDLQFLVFPILLGIFGVHGDQGFVEGLP